jgi:Tfp pilus assembly protein PilO
MDTLIVESKSKEYKATFVKSFKSIKNVQDFRKSLSDMRKSYDHFVVDVLQSYRINIDGIYKRLDEQWDQLFEKHKIDNILKAIVLPLTLK